MPVPDPDRAIAARVRESLFVDALPIDGHWDRSMWAVLHRGPEYAPVPVAVAARSTAVAGTIQPALVLVPCRRVSLAAGAPHPRQVRGVPDSLVAVCGHTDRLVPPRGVQARQSQSVRRLGEGGLSRCAWGVVDRKKSPCPRRGEEPANHPLAGPLRELAQCHLRQGGAAAGLATPAWNPVPVPMENRARAKM